MSEKNGDPQRQREAVRRGYAKLARGDANADAIHAGGACCGGGPEASVVGLEIGYTPADLATVPEGANLGVGCGNPTALGTLQPGEVVLDLGAGAGMDAFLAAEKVGPTGRVIGVDMTDEMVERARQNAARAGVENVEFRRGLIEELPVENASVDAVISNCVINLSPEKDRVFAEAFRVLRPGGRLMVSDIVLERSLPAALRNRDDLLVGCVAGAALRDDYLAQIRAAGFVEIEVAKAENYGQSECLGESFVRDVARIIELDPDEVRSCLDAITSLSVVATKAS